MNLEELEEALQDLLSSEFVIETDSHGEIIIRTGLREDEEGELVDHVSDDEDDEDFDPDHEPLEDDDAEDF